MTKERIELDAIREFLDRVDARAGAYKLDQSQAWLLNHYNAAQAEYADMCKAVHDKEAKERS